MKLIAPDRWRPTGTAASGDKSRPLGTATLGEFLRSGRGLSATCPVCLHSARLDPADLAARYGADHACSEAALRAKLQCSACGSTEAVVQEIGRPGGRDRSPATNARVLANV